MELSSQFAVALAFHVDALVDGQPDEVQRFPALAGHRLRSDLLGFALLLCLGLLAQRCKCDHGSFEGFVVGSATASTSGWG